MITIYDMIHEKFAAAEDQTIRFKRELATRADLIIAISESTKRDIIDILGVPEEKIKVIYLGNSIVPPEGSMNRGTETGAYLLYVGYRGGYKNFEFMVNALNPVFDSHPNLKLICVGGGMFTSRELDVLSLNSMQGRTSQLTVPDSELAQLYAKAVAFICPSKYEGFGIPSLEAMSCGCPAVLSKSSSLPEVGGSAAKYFDPEDSEGLRSSIETLLGNETMRMKMKKEGLAQAAKFSWKNTTMETKEAYEALCQ